MLFCHHSCCFVICRYSFAIVGINITGLAYSLLSAGHLKTHYYNVVQGRPHIQHFHQVYCKSTLQNSFVCSFIRSFILYAHLFILAFFSVIHFAHSFIFSIILFVNSGGGGFLFLYGVTLISTKPLFVFIWC